MLRNLLVMVCCAAVIMSAAFVPVLAEGEIVINGNELATFKNRTKEQIFSLWQDAEIKDYDSIFEEGKEPSYTAPYSGGTVKQEVLQNVRKNLNYYRFLVGSPEITEEFTNQPQLQNASVLQTINLRDWDNGVGLTHSLWDYPKPDDMDQSFYDSAVFANHNIISTYGYKSSIRGFFGESYFTYTAGHRTALLSPYVGSVQMGLGDTTYGRITRTAQAAEAFEEKFAAYPSPGYFPKQDMDLQSDWDIYLNSKYFKDPSGGDVTAKITDLNTLESFDYSEEQGNLSAGFFIFLAAPRKDQDFTYSHSYKVEISGLENLSGQPVNIEYTVNFFDKFEALSSPIKSIGFGGGVKNLAYVGASSREEALKKVAPRLPKSIEATLESGSIVSAPISGWTFGNIVNSYFPGASRMIVCKPQIDKDDIPKNVADPENFTYNMQVYIYDNKGEDFSGNFDPMEKTSGQSAEFNISADSEDVDYTWYKIGTDMVLTEISDGEKYSVNGSSLVVNYLTADDSGYYFVAANGRNWWNFFRISDSVSLDVDGALCILGDVDKNGEISVTDALLALQSAVGKLEIDGYRQRAGDVNADGEISVTDALLILQFAVGKLSGFEGL